MSYYEFGLLLFENVYVYMITFLTILCLYYFLFKKSVNSILDPFVIALFASASGTAVTIFLYLTEKISTFFFCQFIISQIAFWIGLFLYNPKVTSVNTVSKIKIIDPKNKRYYIFFLICSIVYILLKLVTYKIAGIPLFSEYRLSSVAVGGGFGLVNRFVGLFRFVTLFFGFFYYYSENNKLSKIILFLEIVFILLSGSKGAVLSFFQCLYIFLIINRDLFYIRLQSLVNKSMHILVIGSLSALLVISINSDSVFDTIHRLFFRIVSYGDAYYLAYPNEIIDSLTSSKWWIAITGDLFRTLRLISEDEALPCLGFELSGLANNAEGIVAGPNPRHNVFGYVHFGFLGGIIYSFFCGFILGIIRKYFFFKSSKTLYRRFLLFFLYVKGVGIEGDPVAFISAINDLILLFTFIFLVENIVYKFNLFSRNENSLHNYNI